ncbi:hypothetical protein TrVE_jg362, partial [Triparma verrucosa]
LETEETHATTYANSASNSNIIKQNGGTLLHSVDVTNPSTLPKSSSLFSTIIFNFPHVPGKSNNLHNRNLLKSFFQNVDPLLHPSGSIKVVLNSPQSGFDSLTSIDWKASWNLSLQVLPSHVLTSVDPFDINHNLSSYRGSDKSFTTVSPQTYTFQKSGKVCEGYEMCSYFELHVEASSDTPTLPMIEGFDLKISFLEDLEDINTKVYTVLIVATHSSLSHTMANGIREEIETYVTSHPQSQKLRSNKRNRLPSKPISLILYLSSVSPPSPLINLLESNNYTPQTTSLNLDLWGLLHSGSQPYKRVLLTLRYLYLKKFTLNVLSNSSKRLPETKLHLEKLGFTVSQFSSIVTSGEACSFYLSSLPSPKKIFVFGSGAVDDLSYVTDSGHLISHSITECDIILARGTFLIHTDPPISKSGTYESDVKELLEEGKGKEMIVCNPDVYRPDAVKVKEEDLDVMPGKIAMWYSEILSDSGLPTSTISSLIYQIGKPHPLVFSVIDEEDRSPIKLMFGDSLMTDVRGSNFRNGWKSVWTTENGIHRGLDLNNEIKNYDIEPDHIIPTFTL